MAVKQTRYFKIAGADVNGYSAAASFNTDGVDLRKFDGKWSVQISRSLATGTPRATIQVSTDNSNWTNYSTLAASLTIPVTVTDDKFIPNYMRVVYTIGGSPTGTITMWLNQVYE